MFSFFCLSPPVCSKNGQESPTKWGYIYYFLGRTRYLYAISLVQGTFAFYLELEVASLVRLFHRSQIRSSNNARDQWSKWTCKDLIFQLLFVYNWISSFHIPDDPSWNKTHSYIFSQIMAPINIHHESAPYHWHSGGTFARGRIIPPSYLIHRKCERVQKLQDIFHMPNGNVAMVLKFKLIRFFMLTIFINIARDLDYNSHQVILFGYFNSPEWDVTKSFTKWNIFFQINHIIDYFLY